MNKQKIAVEVAALGVHQTVIEGKEGMYEPRAYP
jgi:hypothetical protein